MAVTLKEVAELAGVSRSAVSRTFTEGASVSTKTRQKVEKAAARLGYQPNALASSLTTGRTKLIGLISNNFHNPIFLEVFDLFTRGLQNRGLRPLLVNLSDEDKPEDTVRLLQQYSVDGAIVASSTLPPFHARSATLASPLCIPLVVFPARQTCTSSASTMSNADASSPARSLSAALTMCASWAGLRMRPPPRTA